MKYRKKDKNYKITVYKYNQSVKKDLTNFWVEMFNLDNMNDIDHIDELNLKNFKNLRTFDFDSNNLYGRNRNVYDGTIDTENINVISDNIESGNQIKIIQNTRFIIKMSET